ncbi:Methyltransferase-like protein 23 [Mortierella polycephala]|uniref:Methyltransferase-like protein 23 n=1 Tax=Mortierella polycephala TaxID=41804 RepID=A0A9P6QAX8_9FUNG|nr:Methyltransferase-like protein 23 [Mortierella polycephala]
MESITIRHQACKQYRFESSHHEEALAVRVLEVLDSDFGLYVWPCSLVLAEYIFNRLDMFTGVRGNPKIILELGAGTALPSLLLAKAPHQSARFMVVTDRPDVPLILENIRMAMKENGVHSTYQDDLAAGVSIRGLGWGDFTLASNENKDGGLLQLIRDVSNMKRIADDGSQSLGRIDIILGSDTFYNPSDFEPLLATVSYIINRHNPDCVFLTTYQNRSAKRNIDPLLQKWNLEGRLIQWDDFSFDMSKYIHSDVDPEDEDQDESANETIDEEMDDLWLRQADKEVSREMNASLSISAKRSKLALVDYSSGSDSENDDSAVENGDDNAGEHDASETLGHKIGDGGALSSVHLLWICRRGHGVNFERWRGASRHGSE